MNKEKIMLSPRYVLASVTASKRFSRQWGRLAGGGECDFDDDSIEMTFSNGSTLSPEWSDSNGK